VTWRPTRPGPSGPRAPPGGWASRPALGRGPAAGRHHRRGVQRGGPDLGHDGGAGPRGRLHRRDRRPRRHPGRHDPQQPGAGPARHPGLGRAHPGPGRPGGRGRGHHRPHQRDRQPDKSLIPQRRHRGGPGRRRRPRVRGRGRRGPPPGRTVQGVGGRHRQGDRGSPVGVQRHRGQYGAQRPPDAGGPEPAGRGRRRHRPGAPDHPAAALGRRAGGGDDGADLQLQRAGVVHRPADRGLGRPAGLAGRRPGADRRPDRAALRRR